MATSEAYLREQLNELSSAEEFMEFFNIDYQQSTVRVNRLHILKRFHDLLASESAEDDEDLYSHYRALLLSAYNDFVDSSAQQQKVLKVFQTQQPGFVSLNEL